MPDLKQVLSDEIRRLARKEVKLAVQPLQANVVALRKQISELKKALAGTSRTIEVIRKDSGAPVREEEEKEPRLRLNAAGITRIRKKLKLTQGEFAKVLDVSMHTVSSWEKGRSYPRAGVKARICALRSAGKREIKALLAVPEGEK
ncbi:MAG: helix-turn-helix domain-containing protein [Lentisphaeria bacterium]|nr:helix-turn-helix domain-containing protein [Lentisphaeria bacterium]